MNPNLALFGGFVPYHEFRDHYNKLDLASQRFPKPPAWDPTIFDSSLRSYPLGEFLIIEGPYFERPCLVSQWRLYRILHNMVQLRAQLNPPSLDDCRLALYVAPRRLQAPQMRYSPKFSSGGAHRALAHRPMGA